MKRYHLAKISGLVIVLNVYITLRILCYQGKPQRIYTALFQRQKQESILIAQSTGNTSSEHGSQNGSFQFILRGSKGNSTKQLVQETVTRNHLQTTANTDEQNHKSESSANRPQNWTIILSVNNGYLEFFENWFWYFQQLHLNNSVVIFAEDDTVFKILKTKYAGVVTVKRGNMTAINKAVNWATPLYNKLMARRSIYILEYLLNGHNILHSDTDAVWLQNPLPYLTGNYDMWMQDDGKNDNCVGFMAIRNNVNTVQVMKRWKDILQNQTVPELDQDVLNRLLKSSSVRLKLLDSDKFPHGAKYFQSFKKMKRSEVVVVHNNKISGMVMKRSRFKRYGLWKVE